MQLLRCGWKWEKHEDKMSYFRYKIVFKCLVFYFPRDRWPILSSGRYYPKFPYPMRILHNHWSDHSESFSSPHISSTRVNFSEEATITSSSMERRHWSSTETDRQRSPTSLMKCTTTSFSLGPEQQYSASPVRWGEAAHKHKLAAAEDNRMRPSQETLLSPAYNRNVCRTWTGCWYN